MSTIRVSGDSSGYFDLTVPSAAGTNTIDLSKLPVKDANDNLTLNGNIGAGGTTAFASMGGRLGFDNDYSDSARGPNKILLQNDGNWISGLGISNNSLDIYSGGIIAFHKSTSPNAYTTSMSIDASGVVKTPSQPMLKVGLGSGAYLTGTHGKVPFGSFNSSHVFDPEDNMNAFNTSTNTYTIPSGLGGLWHITAHTYTTGNNANQIAVYVNGSREDAIGTDGGTTAHNQGSIVKRFAAGDQIQIWVFYGAALTVQPNMFHTYWQMNFLG